MRVVCVFFSLSYYLSLKKSCFKELFTSLFRSQHTEASTSVLLRALALHYGEKEGGMILGKASSTGPTVETAGLCASHLEGGGAQSCTESVSGRGWCSLSPSAASWCCFCFRREKLFCPELWSSRDSLRGLVQLLMASDSNWHERI